MTRIHRMRFISPVSDGAADAIDFVRPHFQRGGA
jgi:hypothetical protein